MPTGILSPKQAELVSLYVSGKVVHDIGAGDLGLARTLVSLGAERVVAVDRFVPSAYGLSREDRRIRFVQREVSEFHEPVETLFLSWPVNWYIGLDRMVVEARTIIYLGSNHDGSACGGPELWRQLLQREVHAEVPERPNTLLIYGGAVLSRRPRPEERAAQDHESWHTFSALYGEAPEEP